MSLNYVRNICNTCINVRIGTQGERGPPGNNGDKGERGDDVRKKKQNKTFNIDTMLSDLPQIFIILICVCVCAF